jgi:hypothetical protein
MTKKGKGMTAAYGTPSQVQNQKKKKTKKKVKTPKLDRDSACHKLTQVIAARVACACVPDTEPRCFDSNSRKTIPMTFRARFGVTSSSGGLFAAKISPHIHETYATWTSFGGNQATFGSAVDSAGYTSASTVIGQYRVTSFCVRFFGNAAPTDSQGTVAAIATSQYEATPDVTNTLYDEIEYMPLYESDMMVCGKPEGPESFLYKDVDSVSAGGWPWIYIFGTGLPASTAFGFIEVSIGIEAQIEPETFHSYFLQPAAPSVPQLEAAIANTQLKVPTIIKAKDPETHKRTVWDAAEDAAVELIDSLKPVAVASMLALL